MTLQEQIDALPSHSGGTIYIPKGTVITEPLRVVEKSFVNVVGPGPGQAIVGSFERPGPLFFVSGSPWFSLLNVGLQVGQNVECGVLACRTAYNGPQSSMLRLDNLNVQGDFAFAAVATLGCDSVTITDCRLNPRVEHSYGWWCGMERPTYRIGNSRPTQLGCGLPAFGGTAVGERMTGGYIASDAKGITSIRMDGVVSGRIADVYIANSFGWHPDQPAKGRACIGLGETHNVVLDGNTCESPDCAYGILIEGECNGLSVRSGRYQGRMGMFVSPSGGLIQSEVSRDTVLTTFGDTNRKPILIDGMIQNSKLDIGGYIN